MEEEKTMMAPATAIKSEFAAEDLRLKISRKADVVGPGSYTPRTTLTKNRAATFSFGTASRFLDNKLQYISPRHDSDQLCTASMGPKYFPNKFYVKKTYPAYSMGPAKSTVDERDKQAALEASGATSCGPSAYRPKVEFIKPTAARAAFGRAQRFMEKGLYVSEAHGMRDAANSNGKPAANHYHPKYSLTSRTGASKSFGPTKGGKGNKTDRASFLTHSVKGGLAIPATLECSVEFTKYRIDPGINLTKGSRPVNQNFGISSRFIRPDSQYIGKLQADAQTGYTSPGPKYEYKQGRFGERINSKTPRGGALAWVPSGHS